MDVIVEEVVSTVRTVDNEALLNPRIIARLVQSVIAAVDEKQARERRRKDDARIDDDDAKQNDKVG